MKKLTLKLLIFTLAALPLSTFADGEIDAWYTSKGNEYLVRDSINGSLHALLSIANSGKPNVYIVMYDSECEGASTEIISHNPLYINNTLTQYRQYCNGERRVFMPATEAGRAHIIQEFKLRNFVEIKTHNQDFRALFSAKNFTHYLNEITIQGQGI